MSSTNSTSPSTTPPTAAPGIQKPKSEQIADLLKERAAEVISPKRADAAPGANGKAPKESGRSESVVPTPPQDARSDRPALELLEDEEGDEKTPTEKAQEKTLRDFAAEHGISVKALMGLIATDPGESDEPMSLGALRDHWKETKGFQRERDDFDDWRETAQSEITVARRQVQDIFGRISGLLPPETLARVFSEAEFEHAERVKTAKAQALEFFPEWHDPDRMATDRDRLVAMGGSYGFTRRDIASISDARIVKFMMDAMRLRERYDRLKNGYERERPKLTAPPARKGRAPSIDERAKALAEKGDKDGAIALIVEGALRNDNRKSR